MDSGSFTIRPIHQTNLRRLRSTKNQEGLDISRFIASHWQNVAVGINRIGDIGRRQ